MGRIKKRIKLKGMTDEIIEAEALFDTGADMCGITSELADKLDIRKTKWGTGEVTLADGTKTTKDIYAIGIGIDDCVKFTDTHVWDALPDGVDFVVGNKSMQTIGDVSIDFDNETVTCKPRGTSWFSYITKIKNKNNEKKNNV